MVRPVHQTAEIVPLIHAAYANTIAKTERHVFRDIDVVGDQQGPAITYVDNEPLVTRAVVIIRQKAADEALDFDPPPIVTFRELDASSPSAAPS